MSTLVDVYQLTNDGPVFYRILPAGSTTPLFNRDGLSVSLEQVKETISASFPCIQFVTGVQFSAFLLKRIEHPTGESVKRKERGRL